MFLSFADKILHILCGAEKRGITMTKAKKIILAVTAVVIVGLLVWACVSGGSLGSVKCPDCHGTGQIDKAACETCEGAGEVRGTWWALLPPIIAIGLALITKEVYSSLAIGLVSGGVIYAANTGGLFGSYFHPLASMNEINNNGLIAAVSSTAGVFIFLVELGVIVALVNKAGGSQAFGRWAAKHIKTRTGAMLATFALGVLIFIDDYFNCLTVGSVMKPVTDGHKISRSKFAYLIDATAAPVCMIAPVSSWAAAVATYAQDGQGLKLFITAIPYNFYSLLTFVFIIAICIMNFDYGSMAMHEYNAMYKDDLYTTGERVDKELEGEKVNPNGKVIDLILPVVVLIAVSVFALIYVGGFLDNGDTENYQNFVSAFSNTDATVALPWAGSIALVGTIVYLMARKVVSFNESMEAVPKGFMAMVPPILILTFATALKNITMDLGAKYFVADIMSNTAAGFQNFLPAIIFLVACFLAFSTGTSWGTFGILIPIVLSIFPDGELQVIGISACLAGAVCGDHCSPISDTTIMSSAGAQCNHINHVSTQLPYALSVAGVSFVTYIIAGFAQSWLIALPIGIVLTLGLLFFMKYVIKNRKQAENSSK